MLTALLLVLAGLALLLFIVNRKAQGCGVLVALGLIVAGAFLAGRMFDWSLGDLFFGPFSF